MNSRLFARLISDLDSVDFIKVEAAANTLTRLRDKDTYTLIAEALKNGSPMVQRVMLWTLRNYSISDFSIYLPYLAADNADVREAAQVLFMENGGKADAALRSALESEDITLQCVAVETAGHLRTDSAEEILIHALCAESSYVRALAASALSQYPSMRVSNALLSVLQDDEEEKVVHSALFSLRGRNLSSDALRTVSLLVSHAASEIRAAAVYVLDALVPDSVAYDSDARVRRACVETTASARVVEMLMRDMEAFVRSAAVEAAARQKLACGQTFIALLSDEQPGVRRAAASALGSCGAEFADTAVPALSIALLDSKPGVRAAAANALAEIGTAEAGEVLKRCVDEKNPVLAGIMKNALEKLNAKIQPTSCSND